MDKNNILQVIPFIMEIDKLKSVQRRSFLRNKSREENSAEHSWHLAVMVITLFEYASPKIDLLKAIKMALVHDIVEVYAGDTFCFDENAKIDQSQREGDAAAKIFGLLPQELNNDFSDLWNEFESCETPTAKYVVALDRFQPFIQSYCPEDSLTVIDGLTREEFIDRLLPIKDGLPAYWLFIKAEIEKYYFNSEDYN